MNISKFVIVAAALFFSSMIFLLVYKPIKQSIENYAVACLYDSHGKMSLPSNIEENVNAIAQEMNFSEKIKICKMSANAMKTLGYHNACAAYPSVCLNIIIFNKPHLYISEGFFEDITVEEQRFIIGHELAHIQRHHILYIPLVLFFGIVIVSLFWWFVLVRSIKRLALWIDVKYYKLFVYTFSIMGLFLGDVMIDLGVLAYRRYFERDADNIALCKLKCHDGALKFLDRWSREYTASVSDDYYNIFADHPSLLERKKYCSND